MTDANESPDDGLDGPIYYRNMKRLPNGEFVVSPPDPYETFKHSVWTALGEESIDSRHATVDGIVERIRQLRSQHAKHVEIIEQLREDDVLGDRLLPLDHGLGDLVGAVEGLRGELREAHDEATLFEERAATAERAVELLEERAETAAQTIKRLNHDLLELERDRSEEAQRAKRLQHQVDRDEAFFAKIGRRAAPIKSGARFQVRGRFVDVDINLGGLREMADAKFVRLRHTSDALGAAIQLGMAGVRSALGAYLRRAQAVAS